MCERSPHGRRAEHRRLKRRHLLDTGPTLGLIRVILTVSQRPLTFLPLFFVILLIWYSRIRISPCSIFCQGPYFPLAVASTPTPSVGISRTSLPLPALVQTHGSQLRLIAVKLQSARVAVTVCAAGEVLLKVIAWQSLTAR